MATRKKDLEIVYNLQWKNKLANGGEKTSIVGVYDIPATTLNWELFKSYLLKNSGTTGDDVIVSYCTDNGKEYPIQSQTDFQVALYAFRNKARNGEIINLKLDRISTQKSVNRNSNDVETQFDNNDSMVSTCCGGTDSPPEWFLNYMSQFKKDINEEVTATVSSVLSSALADINKPVTPPVNVTAPPVVTLRARTKSESRRLKKLQPLLTETSTEMSPRDLVKSYKFDSKLEKLERKLAKYKEKRIAIFPSKSSEVEPSSTSTKSKSHHGHKKDKEHKHKKDEDKEYKHKEEEVKENKQKMEEEKRPAKKVTVVASEPEKPAKDEAAAAAKVVTVDSDNEGKMDAAPLNSQTVAPHMLGGEVYLHQWEVVNTGTAPWTSKTSLQFTWGSKALLPIDDVISVPYLKPGDKGTVAVRLQIPKESGTYECYWHFMHKGRRFGHWLGCQIVVDPFDLKGNNSVLETTNNIVNDYSKLMQEGNHCYSECFREQHTLPENQAVSQTLTMAPATSSNTGTIKKEMQKEKINIENEDDADHEQDIAKALHESLLRRIKAKNIEEDEERQQDPSDDTNCSSDSDNQSIASLSDSSVSSKGSQAFVVVPVPDCFLLDKPNDDEELLATDSAASRPLVPQTSVSTTDGALDTQASSAKSEKKEDCDDNNNSEGSGDKSERSGDSCEKDMVFISVPNDDERDDGYVFVYVDGQKMALPKKLLKSEYLPRKSSTPTNPFSKMSPAENLSGKQSPACSQHSSSNSTVIFRREPQEDVAPSAPKDEDGYMSDATNYLSHCSAAGSSFSDANNLLEDSTESSRLFIFPQNHPGYEVVNPASLAGEPQNLQDAVEAINLNVPPQATVSNPTPTGASAATGTSAAPEGHGNEQVKHTVHILPENLVSGAVNVASSAINTARTVFNMIAPGEQPGRWVDGHWVSTKPETPREANLRTLMEMGFWNRDLNATLLARYNDDLHRVIAELVQ